MFFLAQRKMASSLLKIPSHNTPQFPKKTFSSSPSSSSSSSSSQPFLKPISSSSPTKPPTSKEAAILQAKTCLSTTLQKPLLSSTTRLATTKLKRPKQARFALEIPVFDDSPESLSKLAAEIFTSLPINRKSEIAIVWPDSRHAKTALKVFDEMPQRVRISHSDLESSEIPNSADVIVFAGSEASDLDIVERVAEDSYPRPIVMFNPRWGFEEEAEFEAGTKAFVGSIETVYSFMGLEVKGIFSRKNGVVFKCGEREKWTVLVEEEGGELKAVSSFKSRPSISEVENVLYNLIAVNSPVTKGIGFLKGLVSNISGKRED